MNGIQELLSGRHATGCVEWIGIATARLGEIQPQQTVSVIANTGIEGEHHRREDGSSDRQVTLIQSEHLAAIGGLLGRDTVDPGLLRRNIVVSGINLLALKKRRIQIGDVVLRGTGPCPPCSRMNENLGEGGYHAMVGHGGITTVVEKGGSISVGDRVSDLGPVEDDAAD